MKNREEDRMAQVTLGKTGITVNKNGFGALPIQRISHQEAAALLRRAFDSGIGFFDTARVYSNSEEKIGLGLSEVRQQLYIATKTAAETAEAFWKDLHTSLTLLKTDYVDLYQFHNPAFCPKPGDGTGLYEAMEEAKRQGKIRHIGITNHRLNMAMEAIQSGLYETLQFPFNYLSGPKETELVELCQEKNMGFLAMKALSGGLITNSAAAYAFQAGYDTLPIWGIQRTSELEEFLGYIENPPEMTAELEAVIEKDRQELAGSFCRGCGYCMPTCPAKIDIATAARMSLLLRRSPSAGHLSPEGQALMKKVEDCTHCGQCAAHCPYELDTPTLLEENYRDYKEVLAGKPL